MSVLRLGIYIFVLAICGVAAAEEPSRSKVKICIGAFNAEALSMEMSSDAMKKIIDELTSQGATVLTRGMGDSIDGSCFDVPDCLRKVSEDLGVSGVLDIRVLRFGPMVRVAIRTFDAISGNKVLETATTASAKGFPESASFSEDLKRCLEVLTRQTDEQDSKVVADTGEPTEEAEIIVEKEEDIETEALKEEEIPEASIQKEGTLVVKTEPAGALVSVMTDEFTVVAEGRSPFSKKVGSGTYSVMASKEDYENAVGTLTVSAGQKIEVSLALKESGMNLYKKWGYITFWTGIGLAVFGTISMGLSIRTKKDYDSSAQDRSRAWSAAMYAGYGAGGLLITTGALLLSYEPSEAESNGTRAAVSPTHDGQGCILIMSGSW